MDGDAKIEDLVSSIKASNHKWGAWELEFIESLDGREFEKLSPKQKQKVEELWDKL